MSLVAVPKVEQAAACSSDDPPYYVITLSTSVTDRQAAFELAKKITEDLASAHQEIDEFGTTIGLEAEDAFGQERIYEDMEGIVV